MRQKLVQRGVVLALFAALVLALLWFQGILFRHEPELVEVPPPPAVDAAARTAQVESVEIPSVREHPGFVEAEDAAAVAARVMATVLAVAAREGDAVESGQVLVELDDRDAGARLAQAEAGLAAARAHAEQAGLAAARAQRLLDARALTTQEWEAARAADEAARAGVAAAEESVQEARIARAWFRIEAPFTGRVLARSVDPGQLAVPGVPLLTLYREDRLRFAAAVPEERAAGLVPGMEAGIAFDGRPTVAARLVRVLPSADERTGTVTLHFDLAAAKELRPGLLGRIELPAGTRGALLVPDAAVERIGQIERVRLQRDGRVVPVTVRTGRRHGERVEVLSGLAAGERVVLP